MEVEDLYANKVESAPRPSKCPRRSLQERLEWQQRDKLYVSLGESDDYASALEDDVDEDIADAAGLDHHNHRRVQPSCPPQKSTNVPQLAAKSIFSTYMLVDAFYNICTHSCLYAECSECKGKKTAIPVNKEEYVDWMLDSGASVHVTMNMDDFLEYHPMRKRVPVQTANGLAYLQGYGTVILSCANGGMYQNALLSPVYYMPGLSVHLMSMGYLLQNGMNVHGDDKSIKLFTSKGDPFLDFTPRFPGDSIYWTRSLSSHSAHEVHHIVYQVDYGTMHRHFGHPSKEALHRAMEHTRNFPRIEFPSEEPLCPGCAAGKMPLQAFPPSERRATRPFELIHSDLKSLLVESYHKYRYVIMFFDDYTSYAWIVCMRTKNAALSATRQFLAFVENQFKMTVQKWMSDAGGEYKSDAFDTMLKDKGIQILQSAPHTPQQNGHAERFMRMFMDKAETMRLEACIPQNW